MDWWTLTGLAGLALFISAGEVFDPLREWLGGFSVTYNPLHIAGEMLSSALCVGFVVGLIWGGPITGGVVGLAASASSEVLALAYGLMRKVTSVPRPMPMPMGGGAPGKKPFPREVPPDVVVLGEDAAHKALDDRDERRGG